jgi:hypothetical protein
MPVENIRTDNGLGVITRCSGELATDEFTEAIRQRYTPDDALQKIRYFITDHTEVTQFQLSTHDIVALTKITVAASRKNPAIRLASVVPTDLGYGLVRMWHGYAYELAWKSRLCRTRAEAEQWLREEVDANLTFT